MKIQDKFVVSTLKDGVISNNQDATLHDLSPCNIEEADERMLLHVNNISKYYPKITIKTVHSDVVVIATSLFDKLVGVDVLYIEYGIGKSLKIIPIHELVNTILNKMTSTSNKNHQ